MNTLNIVQKYLDSMQVNWGLVSGKQLGLQKQQHARRYSMVLGTSNIEITQINESRHTSLKHLFCGSRISNQDGTWNFFHRPFFPDPFDPSGKCMDMEMPQFFRIFSAGSVFLFLGASRIVGAPEVPMHVNVEAALTEFLACQQSMEDCKFRPLNPSLHYKYCRNLRQIGRRWPKCD